MTKTPNEVTGMLVLRVWSEGSDGNLRARITDSSEVFSAEQRTVAGGVEDICAEVRAWLERLDDTGAVTRR